MLLGTAVPIAALAWDSRGIHPRERRNCLGSSWQMPRAKILWPEFAHRLGFLNWRGVCRKFMRRLLRSPQGSKIIFETLKILNSPWKMESSFFCKPIRNAAPLPASPGGRNAREGLISKQEAVARVKASSITEVLSPQFDFSKGAPEAIAQGLVPLPERRSGGSLFQLTKPLKWQRKILGQPSFL